MIFFFTRDVNCNGRTNQTQKNMCGPGTETATNGEGRMIYDLKKGRALL